MKLRDNPTPSAITEVKIIATLPLAHESEELNQTTHNASRRLNQAALEIILAVQAFKRFAIADSSIYPDAEAWYSRTRKYYSAVPEVKMTTAGLHKNEHDYETILGFAVTDAMMNTPYEQLSQFNLPE